MNIPQNLSVQLNYLKIHDQSQTVMKTLYTPAYAAAMPYGPEPGQRQHVPLLYILLIIFI